MTAQRLQCLNALQVDDPPVPSSATGMGGRRVRRGMTDDDNFGALESRFWRGGEQLLNVRDFTIDELAIGPGESRELQIMVEVPDRISFADEPLGECYQRRIPEVVGPGLKGKTEQSNSAASIAGYYLESSIDVGFVTRKELLQQRHADVMHLGQVHEGARVLRQARSAEGEARAEVGPGDRSSFRSSQNMLIATRASTPVPLSRAPTSLAKAIFSAWKALQRYLTDSATRQWVRNVGDCRSW